MVWRTGLEVPICAADHCFVSFHTCCPKRVAFHNLITHSPNEGCSLNSSVSLLRNRVLRIVVNNELVEKTIYNVIGVLDGHLEPDRYVIVGNHRDSWGFGAMDASSGGAAILESVKTFGELHRKTGWRPRRTLVFASWSGEELGLIGSTEWVEELRALLAAEAVAYLNVDTCVSGPMVKSDASPSLMQALRDATKRVPAHQVAEDRPLKVNQTLYDSWMEELRVNNNSTDETKLK